MSDASSDRLADEKPGQVLAAHVELPKDASSSAHETSRSEAAQAKVPLSKEVEASVADSPTTDSDSSTVPSATIKIASRWQQIDRATRRLILWAALVLMFGLLLRVGRAVQPVFVSPKDRFQNFTAVVVQRLPAVLYGEDVFGQPAPSVDVQSEIKTPAETGGPLKAILTFEDASFSSTGQVLYTQYTIDYQWQRDHWECHNLKCDVKLPELTKLDQMDFNAVLAHESAEKTVELVKLKRAQAEAQLRPGQPLGELLRSGNLF